MSVQSFGAGRFIVGRSPDNEIYVKIKFVSRHHEQFVSDYELVDILRVIGRFENPRQISYPHPRASRALLGLQHAGRLRIYTPPEPHMLPS